MSRTNNRRLRQKLGAARAAAVLTLALRRSSARRVGLGRWTSPVTSRRPARTPTTLPWRSSVTATPSSPGSAATASNERIKARTGPTGPSARSGRSRRPGECHRPARRRRRRRQRLCGERYDGTDGRVQARTLSAAGNVGRIHTLSDQGHDAFGPRIAVTAAGGAVLVWRRSDGTHLRIEAVALSAAGTLGRVKQLSDAGEDTLDPQLAINDAGDAVCTWYRSDGTDDRVQAIVLPASGSPSPVYTLSDQGGDAQGPDVAVDPDGDAYLSWSRWDGSNFLVQTQILHADGTLGLTHTVSDTGGNAYSQ